MSAVPSLTRLAPHPRLCHSCWHQQASLAQQSQPCLAPQGCLYSAPLCGGSPDLASPIPSDSSHCPARSGLSSGMQGSLCERRPLTWPLNATCPCGLSCRGTQRLMDTVHTPALRLQTIPAGRLEVGQLLAPVPRPVPGLPQPSPVPLPVPGLPHLGTRPPPPARPRTPAPGTRPPLPVLGLPQPAPALG